MNHKLDGAGVAPANRSSTPQIRMLVIEPEQAPNPESIRRTQSDEAIRRTQSAQERAAAARLDRIAVVAYLMAEVRGFAPGHDAEDWALAQAQVDAEDAASFEN